MITLKNAHYCAGYSGSDHLLDDSPLEAEIGRQFRSVGEIAKRLNSVAARTIDHRCALPPIKIVVQFADRTEITKKV